MTRYKKHIFDGKEAVVYQSWKQLAKLYKFKSADTLRSYYITKLTRIGQWPITQPVKLFEFLPKSFKVKKQPQEWAELEAVEEMLL